MKAKRLWWIAMMYLTPGTKKRADYARKHNIYRSIGKNVIIQPRFIPTYSELIAFHNNIVIARNVDFCTHDAIHQVLNKSQKDFSYKEQIGCIEIMDNVFIGSNSVVLYGTKIGPNVIVASGSVVTKDCEPNSVYAGCPAKRIGSFQEYMEKRKDKQINNRMAITMHNQALTDDEIENAWKLFNESHA